MDSNNKVCENKHMMSTLSGWCVREFDVAGVETRNKGRTEDPV